MRMLIRSWLWTSVGVPLVVELIFIKSVDSTICCRLKTCSFYTSLVGCIIYGPSEAWHRIAMCLMNLDTRESEIAT